MQTNNLELPKKKNNNEQEQHQPEHLECPRCGSSNTKFCYYNNYDKSQPRHFCKGCKRHWTKGGTLRNVPHGSVRKNKRQKLSNSATCKNISVSSINHTAPMASSDSLIFSPAAANASYNMGTNEDNLVISQAEVNKGSTVKKLKPRASECSFLIKPEDNYNGFINNFIENNTFLGSDHEMFFLEPSQNQSKRFTCSEIGHFGSNLPSFVPKNQSLDAYEYTLMPESSLESTITTTMPMSGSSIVSQKPCQASLASGFMDLSSLCDWNEINSLVSADVDVVRDESEIK